MDHVFLGALQKLVVINATAGLCVGDSTVQSTDVHSQAVQKYFNQGNYVLCHCRCRGGKIGMGHQVRLRYHNILQAIILNTCMPMQYTGCVTPLTCYHRQVLASAQDLKNGQPEYLHAKLPLGPNIHSRLDHDPFVGVWVVITKGPYREYCGIIKVTWNTIIQVELEAGVRVVTVKKANVTP